METEKVALAELEYWGLSVKSLNLLDRAGFSWLDDLIGVNRRDLEKLDGWGPKRTEELIGAIKAFLKNREKEHENSGAEYFSM